MTGKELVLALVGAGIVGGGAGIAATALTAPKPEASSAGANAELLDRLKSIETQLAEAKKAADESRRTMLEVENRVTKAEIQASQQAANAASSGTAAPVAGTTFRVGRHGTQAAPAQGGAIEFGGEGFQDLGEAIAINLGEQLGNLGGELGDVSGQLEALQNGMKLRQLPEAERWQKATDELGLSASQVDELKRAVTDRDTAMKDAMTKETKTGPNGGTLTIQRPDPAKSAHAEAAYHDRVNSTLSEQQKKDWSSKGYDNAFGSAPFGRSVMMAIDIDAESKPGVAPKDAPK
jgi:hypothetical protein